MSNLADFIRDAAADRPHHVAVIDGARRTTYARLDHDVSAFASGLIAGGVGAGDRVALLVGNRTEFVVALYGTLRAGAVAVPLNTGLAAAEIEHALHAVGARLLICDSVGSQFLDGVELGSCGEVSVGSRGWKRLLAGVSSGVEFAPTDPDSPALLLFTAGSTGKPKAAILSHRALSANVSALLELDDPPAMTRDDRSLAVLPLFHVYSLNAVLTLTMAAGATVVLCDRFSAAESLRLISDHDVTVVAGAPPMYVAWSAEPGLRESLRGVRLLLSGAAPLPPALFHQFQTVTGKPVWEGYGLTECSPVVSTTLVGARPKSGSVGRPLSNVDIRLESGFTRAVLEHLEDPFDDAEDSEPGEIWIRGPSVFSGYWPDGSGGPDDEGWFATGDVGYFDEDGDLHLVDRRTDLILVSGFNVYPREVEHVIEQHPAVVEVAVIGVPHPYSGQAVKALVAPLRDWPLEAEEIVKLCEERLARFKCPTIIEIVDSLPHLPTGKVAKALLK